VATRVRTALGALPPAAELEKVLPADACAGQVDGAREPLASWLRVWDWSPLLPARVLAGGSRCRRVMTFASGLGPLPATVGACSSKPVVTSLSSCAAAAASRAWTNRIVAVISTHCLDISEPKTVRGLEVGYRLYTARWDLTDLPDRRRPPTSASGPDRLPPADPGEPAAPRPPGDDPGE
jgi:hypothetical protein